MRNRVLLAAGTSLLLCAMLAGCSGMDKVGDLGHKNLRPNSVKYDAFGNELPNKGSKDNQSNQLNRFNGLYLNTNNAIGSHKNKSMEMNEQMADQITRLEAVKSSYVVVTDRNAYVAVSFNDDEPKSNAKMMNRTEGMLDGQETPGKNMQTQASADEYMLTEEMREEISAIVLKIKSDTEHVFITANPDFVLRLNMYMNDVKLGHPIQDYVAEFNAMAERIFPVKATERTEPQNNMSNMNNTSRKNMPDIYD